MKHWSLNLYPPLLGPFGRFSLANAQVDWGRSDMLSHTKGWLTITFALFGFSAVITYWPMREKTA